MFTKGQRPSQNLLQSWHSKATGSLRTGSPAATKARATWSFSILCSSRASTGGRHQQRLGTQQSSSWCKPTATLTVLLSSLGLQYAIGTANSQSPIWSVGSIQKGSQLKRTVKAGLNFGTVRCSAAAVMQCRGRSQNVCLEESWLGGAPYWPTDSTSMPVRSDTPVCYLSNLRGSRPGETRCSQQMLEKLEM